jgi:hypothetical protein
MLRELLASITVPILAGDLATHALMRNTDLIEFGSLWNKGVTQVELQGVNLRMQVYSLESLTARLPHEPLQKSFPDAQSSKLLEDCKAPNLTGAFQAARANCVTFRPEREGVQAGYVSAIPLFLLGNLLFDDENGTTDVLQRFALLQPGCRDDGEICVDGSGETLDLAGELRCETKIAFRRQFQ